MSCAIGHRCSSDPLLLWLWHRMAAVAPIQPLAWEFPYAMPVLPAARQKKKKRKMNVGGRRGGKEEESHDSGGLYMVYIRCEFG